jgi:hypothetical protein
MQSLFDVEGLSDQLVRRVDVLTSLRGAVAYYAAVRAAGREVSLFVRRVDPLFAAGVVDRAVENALAAGCHRETVAALAGWTIDQLDATHPPAPPGELV